MNKDSILQALSSVSDPEVGRPLVAFDAVRDVRVDGTAVAFQIALPRPAHPAADAIASEARAAALAVPGVDSVDIQMTVDVLGPPAAPQAGAEQLITSVKNVVLVGSGKGGVGKSTVATNLALAISAMGVEVGLLDADIYGPSMPIMMGSARPRISDDKRIIPIGAHGIEVMSIGYLVDPDQAMVWRGPMLNGAVIQLLRDVAWGALDYLVVDLPPGTGDVQLTIAQKIAVSGAAIVTTPQEVALADVVRAKRMFDQVSIPALGVVENMSTFACPNCDTTHEIFASGGGQRAASDLSIPYLGSIPIDPRIREAGDRGTPLVASHPDSAAATAFGEIASALVGQIATHVVTKPSGQIPISVVGPQSG